MEEVAKSAAREVEMPCGNRIDLHRPRSQGVLSPDEIDFLRRRRLPLAYDPVQIGWLPATATDDIATPLSRRPRPAARPRFTQTPQTDATSAAPRYRLRAWSPQDLHVFRGLLDDPQVWAYMPEPYPDPLTAEQAAALIELSNASNHHQVYAVERNGGIVGQVRALFEADPEDPGVVEISYWLGRAHWGRGIASDIVALFADRCFMDNPGVDTLIARVHRDNPASIRVLEKAGFSNRRADPEDGDRVLLSRSR